MRDGCGHRERSCASEHVEFGTSPIVKHRAARSGDRRWDGRTGGPGVSRDVVDLQVRHFSAAIVTTGNVKLAIDGPEPGQVHRCRHRSKGSPAVSGYVVGIESVGSSDAIVAARHVDDSIIQPSGKVAQPDRHRGTGSPGVGGDVVDPGEVAFAATPIKPAGVINLAVEEHRLGQEVPVVRRWSQGRISVSHRIIAQQVVVDGAAVVPATDVVEGAIAHHEGSARGKCQRSNLRPLIAPGRACGCRRGRRCATANACGRQCLAGTDRRGLPTTRIAPVLIEVRVIFFHSYHQLAVVWCSCGRDGVVDVLERWRPVFVQGNLIIQRVRRAEVHRAPLDIEDPVGRAACCGGEDSVRNEDSLVAPERCQRVGSAGDSKRRAGDSKTVAERPKGRVTIGPDVDTCEVLIIQVDRERKYNVGAAIVTIKAEVVHARHERSRVQSEGVVSAIPTAACRPVNTVNLVRTGCGRNAC